ncbi:MAG: GreA/GreB family elongation factor [Mizugakiibacter sp.]|uniref:GreA/GreB family elongation factor n=1 Tax=Mizugakiibacter sp. TaxID=1972610 RepID=UPI0031C7A8C2|nr:GreA/GreB family elongation factor [Xanthomonadaceae bacterium]
MSRAFVKESDASTELPELPLSPHPNYVTPRGLELLKERRERVRAETERLAEQNVGADTLALAHAQRELRWLDARIGSALPVDAAAQPPGRVAFGCTVDVEDADGHRASYRIVGEDEADAAHGLVSWVSPLARALLGARVGDEVIWKRPAGDLSIEVRGIRCGDAPG